MVAIAMATIGSAIKIKSGVIDKIPQLLGKPSVGYGAAGPLPQQETASRPDSPRDSPRLPWLVIRHAIFGDGENA